MNRREQRIRKLRNKAHQQPKEVDFWGAFLSLFCCHACQHCSGALLPLPYKRFFFSFILHTMIRGLLYVTGYLRTGTWTYDHATSLMWRRFPFQFSILNALLCTPGIYLCILLSFPPAFPSQGRHYPLLFHAALPVLWVEFPSVSSGVWHHQFYAFCLVCPSSPFP